MSAPSQLVGWINRNVGFNPRAGKYSVALSEFVMADLKAQRPELGGGAYIAECDADVATLSATRNIDFVLWVAAGEPSARMPHIATENKLILAAHGKARKNRLGDIVAFANHIHNANSRAIAAGLIGLNLSADYENPDPFAEGMTRRRLDMNRIVADTIDIYARIPQRSSVTEPGDRPEAFGVIVFRYDGKRKAALVTDPPAPQEGHPLHYGTFIRRICELHDARQPR